MNNLLVSVLLTTFAVLAGGAVFLVLLLALAGIGRPRFLGWSQRSTCQLSLDCLDQCEAACKG